MQATSSTDHSVISARRLFLTGLALAITGSILFSAKGVVVKLHYRQQVDAMTVLALRMLFSLPFLQRLRGFKCAVCPYCPRMIVGALFCWA